MPFFPVLFAVVTAGLEYSPRIDATYFYLARLEQITGMHLAGEAGLGLRLSVGDRLDFRVQLTVGYFDELLFRYSQTFQYDDGYSALGLRGYYRLGESFSIGAGVTGGVDFHLQLLLNAQVGVSWALGSASR